MEGNKKPSIANITGKITNGWQLVEAVKMPKPDCLNSNWKHTNTYFLFWLGGVPYEELDYQKAKDYLNSVLKKYPQEYGEFEYIDANKHGLPYLAKKIGDETVEILYFGLEVQTYRPFYLPFSDRQVSDSVNVDVDKNVQFYL